MEFNGDIIITDPCYIDTDDRKLWDSSKTSIDINIFTGEGISNYGFTKYLWRDTLYGDWSCSVFNLEEKSKDTPSQDIKKEDTIKTIGTFCADAGLVGVFLLEEVLRFNPGFDYHLDRLWTTTLIQGFKGNISMDTIITENQETELVIRGVGSTNFISRQTGF